MISKYLLISGIIITLVGVLEMLAPQKVFSFWKSWSANRYFFLHGIFLIFAGLPLTIYQGPLSTPVFIIGIIIVLTGPFMLLYPEKFKTMFDSISNEIDPAGVSKMIYFDGGVRILIGMLLIAAFALNTFSS